MMNTALCTKAEIKELVDDFYNEIRTHQRLGPIFNAHIHDWPTHLDTMVSFWSSILLKTGEFNRKPAEFPHLLGGGMNVLLILLLGVCMVK